jgi:hypothetical protein
VARLDARLRAPRKEAPNLQKLREVLEQRAADWRRTLREEPKVARLLIRRMIGPLELYDGSLPQFQLPKAAAVVKTGLIDGQKYMKWRLQQKKTFNVTGSTLRRAA